MEEKKKVFKNPFLSGVKQPAINGKRMPRKTNSSKIPTHAQYSAKSSQLSNPVWRISSLTRKIGVKGKIVHGDQKAGN